MSCVEEREVCGNCGGQFQTLELQKSALAVRYRQLGQEESRGHSRKNGSLPYDYSTMKALDILDAASFLNHVFQALHMHVRNIKHARKILHHIRLALQR